MPTPNSIGTPVTAYVPGAATPNPEPDVPTAAFPPPAYLAGQATITGMAAGTVNAGNQTTPGTPGPQGGFQLVGSTTGATRTDGQVVSVGLPVDHVSMSPLTATLDHTARATFCTVTPTAITLQINSTTVTLVAAAFDQNHLPIGGQTFNYVSSAPSVASVGASTGLVTPLTPGSAVVTVTVVGTTAQATCAVTSQTAASFNEPPGLTTVINSGPLTVAPIAAINTPWINNLSTWSQAGSSPPNVVGYSPNNLQLVPPGDTGYRIIYPANLQGGGYSPVRFGSSFANGVTFSKEIYIRFRVRLDPNYSTNGNAGTKIWEPSVNGSTANHVIEGYSAFGNGGTSLDWWLYSGLQLPFSSYYSLNPGADCKGGAWHLCEVLWIFETVPGQHTGTIKMWVDNVQYVNAVGTVNFFNTGETPNYHYFFSDPTFGGGPNSPVSPNGTYVDFDQVYVSGL